MNLQIFFWLTGIVGTLIVILLSIIGFLLVFDRKSLRDKDEKQDKWMLSMQKEINQQSKEIASTNSEMLHLTRIVQRNQDQDSKRMDLLERSFNGDLAERIATKLRAMGG